MPFPTGSPVYALMILVGITIGVVFWIKQGRDDPRIPLIYFGGLVGAFAGAKLAFLLAEGWLYLDDPNRWLLWLSGKSIMGALPGGWLGVELTKKALGYTAITGDKFALLIPIPLALGRLGCLHAGCCPGLMIRDFRWPAVPVELGFQLVALGVLLQLRRFRILPGQHFHLYLMAYGLFRFGHEFLRATPKVLLGLSGYQWIALATVAAAAVAFARRRCALMRESPQEMPCEPEAST